MTIRVGQAGFQIRAECEHSSVSPWLMVTESENISKFFSPLRSERML